MSRWSSREYAGLMSRPRSMTPNSDHDEHDVQRRACRRENCHEPRVNAERTRAPSDRARDRRRCTPSASGSMNFQPSDMSWS